MDIKDDIFNNPEKYVLIRNEKQILEVYGELFDKLSPDILPFYIEKENENSNPSFRLIITPSGVVAVNSEEKNYIWELDFNTEKGLSLLEQLNLFCARAKSGEIQDLVQKLETKEQKYFLRIFPYDDHQASQVLVDELDQKYTAYSCTMNN